MRNITYSSEEEKKIIIENLKGEVVAEDYIHQNTGRLTVMPIEDAMIENLKPYTREVEKAERQIQLIDDLNELGVL